jgi:hypothetical protein
VAKSPTDHHRRERDHDRRELDEDRLCAIETLVAKLVAQSATRHATTHRLLKEIKHMNQESLALLQRLDTATNAIAARIQALLDRPDTTEAEFRAALEPEVARLEGFASDPADPTPDA